MYLYKKPTVILLALLIFIALTSLLYFSGMLGITGAVTGTTSVEVLGVVQISLPVSTVNFGTIEPNETNSTTDNNPPPFLIQNEGNIIANITIKRDPASSALFNGTGGGDNTSSFQFEAANSTELNSFNWAESLTTWTNVPGTTELAFLKELKYVEANDTAEIELKIQVPPDEPAGAKSETLVFTASQA